MSAWPATATLSGSEGELILIRLTVEPRLLEDLLETLAELPFHINPQINHQVAHGQGTTVEFPAYESWTPQIDRALARAHLGAKLAIRPMVAELGLAS